MRADELHPQAQALLDELDSAEMEPLHELSPQRARERAAAMRSGGGPAVGAVEDRTLDGPGGDLPVRIYRPEGDGPAPTVVHFHGGGWVVGDLDGSEQFCRHLCLAADAVVVSVDYRLAPEHPFPAAVEDAVAATEWAADCQDDLGGADRGLAVAGDSAGGNLAAVAALVARDSDGPDIDHQALVYPVVSAGDDWDSYRENGEGYFLERESMAWFEGHYFDSEFHRRNPYAFPLAACDLSGLPPATVLTAGYDPLRDEGAAYADRLAADGVAVSHHNFDDVIHGFVGMLEPPMELDRAHDAVDVLGDALGDL